MLFWCVHPSTMTSWDSLHRREKEYIVTCLQTPGSWKMPTRLAFAKTAVQQMWQEATTIMAHAAILSRVPAGAMAERAAQRSGRRQGLLRGQPS